MVERRQHEAPLPAVAGDLLGQQPAAEDLLRQPEAAGLGDGLVVVHQHLADERGVADEEHGRQSPEAGLDEVASDGVEGRDGRPLVAQERHEQVARVRPAVSAVVGRRRGVGEISGRLGHPAGP